MAEPVSSAPSHQATADATVAKPGVDDGSGHTLVRLGTDCDTGYWPLIWAALFVLSALSTFITQMLRQDSATGMFLPVFALLVCLLAAIFDAATTRIPNLITYPAILAGLALNSTPLLIAKAGGPDLSTWLGAVGPGPAFLGFAVCAAIGIICLLSAGMGGGDVKLMVALGTLLGFSQATNVLLWTLAIAVPYALINLLVRGRLNAVLAVAAMQLLQMVYLRRLEPIPALSRSAIPLAVPLTLALACSRVVPQEVVARWLGGA